MNDERRQISDDELEQALGFFRQSVKEWSEQESASVRVTPQPGLVRGRGWWMVATLATCALAVVAWFAVSMSEYGNRLAQQAHVEQMGVEQMGAGVLQTMAHPVQTGNTAANLPLQAEAQANVQSVQAVKSAVATRLSAKAAADKSDDALLAGVDSDIEQGTAKALAPMADWMSNSAN